MTDAVEQISTRVFLAVLLFLVFPASGYAQASTPSASWWERISFSGDLRLRYEGFFQDESPARNRARFRLRFGFGGDVNDEVRFGVRLASGERGDAASSNQSLTDFFSRKPISIDRVFVAYTPQDAPVLTIGAGKFGYPVQRTQMTWDDDVNWEGVYQEITAERGDVDFTIAGVQAVLAESRTGDDAAMFVVAGGLAAPLGRHRLQLSAANYAFREIDRLAAAVDADPGLLKGRNTNSVRRNGAGRVLGFDTGFNLFNAIAEATLTTGRADYPVTITFDWVTNTQADDDATGIWIETAYGNASAPATYEIGYTFARIERDAVLSPYTFSDIPGTNITMNRFVFSYMPLARLNLDVTSILTKEIDPAADSSDDLLHRLQIDARIGF
jgi:hypothetical protein